MRHRALRINRRDLLECCTRLRIGHVMQEGDSQIELLLSLLRAGDGKVDDAQGVVGMLLGLALRFVRAALKQNEHQANYEVH